MNFEKDKIYTSSVRTNIQISADYLKTERQWAKLGYIAIDKNCGKRLWVNQYCQKQLLYLYVDEVRIATEYELLEFFRPEREKQEIKKQKKLVERKHKLLQKLCKTIIDISDISNKNDISTAETIVIDTETTGLNAVPDEILQLSIIDGKGNKLYNSYFRPLFLKSWKQAQAINNISPEIVRTAPTILDEVAKINSIISGAKKIIGYNTYFDLGFLSAVGIDIADEVEVTDVMQDFAYIYGEYNDYYDDYKYPKLSTCAKYYGYDWQGNAHDSLTDCYATLFCYNKMTSYIT